MLKDVHLSSEFCQTPLPLLRNLALCSYCVEFLDVFVQLEEKAKGRSNCCVWLLDIENTKADPSQ